MSWRSHIAPRLIIVRAFARERFCRWRRQAGTRLVLEQIHAIPGNESGFTRGRPDTEVVVAAPRDAHNLAALQRHAYLQRGHRSVKVDIPAVTRAINPSTALRPSRKRN